MRLIQQLWKQFRINLVLFLMLALSLIILGFLFSTEFKATANPKSSQTSIAASLLDNPEQSLLNIAPATFKNLSYNPNFFSKNHFYHYTDSEIPDAGILSVKLTWPSEFSDNAILYLKGISAENFAIFNKDGSLLYQYELKPFTKNYTEILSELYLEPSDSEVYILMTYNKSTSYVGFRDYPTLYKEGTALMDLTVKYQNRQAIALSLLILATMLILLSIFLPNPESKQTFNAIIFFLFCFNIWIFTDLHRNNYLIQKSFPQVEPSILLILFILSKNFMTPAFVYMNGFLLEKIRSKQINYGILIMTLIAAFSEAIPDLLRLFYWNDLLLTMGDTAFGAVNLIISLGSFGLLALALYDSYKGSKRSIVLSVGLSVCLLTFFISQTTSILISHWGVMMLLASIVIILTDKFNTTQNENAVYTKVLLQKNKEAELLNLELSHTQTELMLRMGSLVDLRSHETSMHVHRVSEYVRLIGKKLGLDDDSVELIAQASTLHDIGKVGTPDAILNSSTKLTSAEFDEMKRHAAMGYEILNGSVIEILDVAAIIALNHHERHDGSGYPEGLSGEDIPLQGKIVAAADVLDALLSARVYKEAWHLDEALAYFKEEQGKHFDPQIAQAVIDSRSEIQDIIKNLPY